jgi:putative transposase
MDGYIDIVFRKSIKNGACKKALYSDKPIMWTQSISVGSKTFIEKMKGAFGYRARGRKIIRADDTCELRKVITPFGTADNYL